MIILLWIKHSYWDKTFVMQVYLFTFGLLWNRPQMLHWMIVFVFRWKEQNEFFHKNIISCTRMNSLWNSRVPFKSQLYQYCDEPRRISLPATLQLVFRSVCVHNNIKLLILLMLKLSNTIKTWTEDSFWETCYAAPRRNVFMWKILAS